MILGVGQSRCIASLVLPRLKVHGLGWADAEHDSQNFHVGHPLSQRWIEASAALLDSSKVEASRVGDRLNVIAGSQVVIASRDCRMLADSQSWDCLRECITEIRVFRTTAVASPPGRVHCELHDVRQPSDLLRPSRLATWQCMESVYVNCIRA